MRRLTVVLLALAMLLGAAGACAQMEIQQFPASGDMYEMLDLSDPYKTVISGLFRQEITEGGLNRTCYVYIGAGNSQSQPNVTIIPDSKAEVAPFLEQSGWKDIADEQGLILLIAVPEAGGWQAEQDLDYLNGLWTQTHVRYWYNCQKHNSYMLAYGDGASLGQMWGMQAVTPQKLVSFATFGDFTVDPAYMEETAALDTYLDSVKVGDIPMPVWFFVTGMDENRQQVLDYWNKANDVGGEVLSSEWATAIYRGKANTADSLINAQDFLAETRYTIALDAAAWDNPRRTRAVWSFLSSVIRPVSYANNELRPARSLEDWGAQKRTLEVDGVTRYWVEYVPQQLNENEQGKAPLLVLPHANNQTAELYMTLTDGVKLANERGIIVMFPVGALYHDDAQMPNPHWNLAAEENKFDDYAFIRAAIEDVIGRLPVDTSRVYMAGLSYGSMATQAFAPVLSDILAAIAPASGMVSAQRTAVLPSDLPQDKLMPVFMIMGGEEADTAFDSEGMRQRFGPWLEANGLGSDFDAALSGYYKLGNYNVWTFANQDGVPLVQYATGEGRIHTVVPDDLKMQYDSFLCKYSRGEDGTLYYMGRPVKK